MKLIVVILSAFVALTTANHPDVLMPAYNQEWFMMLLLFSFMLVTNLFLLNIFLAVVTTQYSNMVQQFYLGKNDVCEGILVSAYRLLQAADRYADSPIGQSLADEPTDNRESEIAIELPPKRESEIANAGMQQDEFYRVIELLEGTHRGSNKCDETKELWFNIMDADGAVVAVDVHAE